MTRRIRTVLMTSALFLLAGATHAAGLSGHVSKVDPAGECLFIEWNNDTERQVCWKENTRFSVLETEKAAAAADVRQGSYLMMEGEETAPWRDEDWGREGQFWATEIVIWEEQSRPVDP